MESALFFQSLKKCLADSNNCEQIGVRVLARALHRHRCLYSDVTLVDAIDTHTPYTHDSRHCQPPTGDCAYLEVSENFVIFM